MLTSELTLATLAHGKKVGWIGLAPGHKRRRRFYYLGQWSHDLKSWPAARINGHRGSASVQSQVSNLAKAFVAGQPLAELEVYGMYPVFVIMEPDNHLVWEMRTTDTRTFGWFAEPSVFVAVTASIKALMLEDDGRINRRLYDKSRDLVVASRKALGIGSSQISSLTDVNDLLRIWTDDGRF